MDIRIRKMTENDPDSLHDLLSDEEVMRYIEAPYSREKTESFLCSAGLADDPLIYAAEADGEFIGYCIFHPFDEKSMEIGWILKRSAWGKGYACRLTELMLRRCRDLSKDAVIECDPEQETTRHIAEKYGFTYTGEEELSEYRLSVSDIDTCRNRENK